MTFFESGDCSPYADFTALNIVQLERLPRSAHLLCANALRALVGYAGSHSRKSRALILNWGTDGSWKVPQALRFFARHVYLYVTIESAAETAARSLGLDNVIQSQWPRRKHASGANHVRGMQPRRKFYW